MKAKSYKLGGDLLAGAAGIIGGAAGNIPIVGSMVEQGVYNIHNKLDNNLSDQEKQIRSGASAAGSIATGIITGNPVGGVKNSMDSLYDLSQSFQFGGSPQQPQYEAEAGEVVDGGIPTSFGGGQVAPTSSDAAVIQGQTHEQGGVALKGGERVFSDTLKPSSALSKEIGYTGTTYAKIAEKITKKIGKLEEQAKSADRFAKESAKRMLPTLQAKLDKVFENQEITKQAALAKDYNKLQMKYGGMLPKYNLGGNPPPPFEEWISQNPELSMLNYEDQNREYAKLVSSLTPAYIPPVESSNNPQSSGIPNPVLPGENWQQYRDRVLGPDAPEAESMALLNDFNTFISSPDNNVQFGQSQSNIRTTGRPQNIIPSDLATQYAGPTAVKQGDGTYLNTGAVDTPISGYNPTTAEKAGGAPTGDTPPPPGTNPMTWQDALYKGAVYAPTIYNAVRGMQKPQVLNADEFQNPYEQKSLDLLASRRYNIDPQLQSNRSSFNNLRENIKSASGGNSGSYLSNIQSSQINKDRADATAYATKNNFDNQYIGDEASAYGTFGAQRAATKLGIQDINDRNRAARNSFLGAAATGVSNIAQNEKHMSNLKANDAIRTNTLDSMYSDWGYETDASGRPTGKLKYKG